MDLSVVSMAFLLKRWLIKVSILIPDFSNFSSMFLGSKIKTALASFGINLASLGALLPQELIKKASATSAGISRNLLNIVLQLNM